MLTSIKSRFFLKLTVITILLISFTSNALGQVKDEREERINASELAEELQLLIAELPKDCKRLKFYKEIDGSKFSYEIKFKFKKEYYSLEFSENGILEDIEITTKLKKIDSPIRSSIENYYKESYANYKIIKLQKQYKYDSKKVTINFIEDVLSKKIVLSPNFEIIAEVKKKNKRILKEFTFNNNGIYINSRELTPTSYEHVLY